MSSSLPKPKETSLISSTATNQPKDEDDDKTTPPLLKDKLFSAIESTHQDTEMKGFGRFLDAGTGSHSLKWIGGLLHAYKDDPEHPLHISSYVAVTADEEMKRSVEKEAEKLSIQDKGEVIIGNWFPSDSSDKDKIFPNDEMFDTILADYLIGAMDGFSPFKQDEIFDRLYPHLSPGGLLHIIGLEPIPDFSSDKDADIMCRVRKVRDACILLAGHRCYREYPLEWILRQIQQKHPDKYEIVSVRKFPILYSHDGIVRQINVGRSKLSLFKNMSKVSGSNDELVNGMEKLLSDLEQESKEATQKSNNGRIRLGFDYVVSVKKVGEV